MKGIDRRLEALLGLVRQHARGENQPIDAILFEPDHRETKAAFMCECGASLCDARVSMSGSAYDGTAGPVIADGHGPGNGARGKCGVCGRPHRRERRRRR